jgi:hypothetical protein
MRGKADAPDSRDEQGARVLVDEIRSDEIMYGEKG